MSGTAHPTLHCASPFSCLMDSGDSIAQHGVRHGPKEITNGQESYHLGSILRSQAQRDSTGLVMWVVLGSNDGKDDNIYYVPGAELPALQGPSLSLSHFTATLWEAGIQPVQKRQGLD